MLVIQSDNPAFFDVDETLVLWDYPPEREHEAIHISIPGNVISGKVVPHLRHIEMVKRHKAWGNGVVVWSRSGFAWAKAVVEALGLEPYVDAVACKPMYYYDDRKCCQFMKEHRYHEDRIPEYNAGDGQSSDTIQN